MEIKMIGTGSISSKSASSSVLINDNILVDVGNGIYKRLINEDIDIEKIEYIFITHNHGDHIFDLPYLLYGLSKRASQQKIIIFGPRGLKRKVIKLTRLAFPYSHIGILKRARISYISSHQIKKYMLNTDLFVESFQVKHGNTKNCYGYKFNDEIAITGDTAYTDNLLEISKNLKYLICDATRVIGDQAHMGVDQIKQLANNKNLKIITTHMSTQSKKKLSETKFKNKNVIIAEDSDVITTKE